VGQTFSLPLRLSRENGNPVESADGQTFQSLLQTKRSNPKPKASYVSDPRYLSFPLPARNLHRLARLSAFQRQRELVHGVYVFLLQ